MGAHAGAVRVVDRRGIGMTSLRTRERLVARLQERGIVDFHVLAAIRDVPRHLFVDEALASRAYEDTALPIGFRQTISRPYVVARMTEVACKAPGRARVLEVGSGCGYQSAVLAQLFEQVVALERIGELVARSTQRLRTLGVDNVRIHHCDGVQGWRSAAPFDAIVVCAAAPSVPAALVEQLADGGTLVAPVGEGSNQRLTLVRREADGLFTDEIDACAFVPMLPNIV